MEGCVGLDFFIRSGQAHLSSTSFLLRLLLLLLGRLLLGGRGLSGLGRLHLCCGLGWRQCLLSGLLGGGLLLLRVGGERSSAARDVDVLAVVGHMLQSELGTVASAKAHGAGPQCGCSLTHF